MKRSELKDGMWVVYRNGTKRFLWGGRLFENRGVNNIYDTYREDLRAYDASDSDFDICEVCDEDGALLWSRSLEKERELIENALGVSLTQTDVEKLRRIITKGE